MGARVHTKLRSIPESPSSSRILLAHATAAPPECWSIVFDDRAVRASQRPPASASGPVQRLQLPRSAAPVRALRHRWPPRQMPNEDGPARSIPQHPWPHAWGDPRTSVPASFQLLVGRCLSSLLLSPPPQSSHGKRLGCVREAAAAAAPGEWNGGGEWARRGRTSNNRSRAQDPRTGRPPSRRPGTAANSDSRSVIRRSAARTQISRYTNRLGLIGHRSPSPGRVTTNGRA